MAKLQSIEKKKIEFFLIGKTWHGVKEREREKKKRKENRVQKQRGEEEEHY